MSALLAAQAQDPTAQIGSVGSEIFDYFKLLLLLAGIVAFAFLVLRLWLPRLAGLKAAGTGPIRVVARLTLEPRKNLYIVKAAQGYSLVATSESGVHYLTALDSGALESALSSMDTALKNEPGAGPFARALRRLKSSP
jgi:flagellar biogenesis protein FliO